MKPQTLDEKKNWLKANFGDAFVTKPDGKTFTSALEGWSITGGGKLGPPVKASGKTADESIAAVFDRMKNAPDLVNRKGAIIRANIDRETFIVSKSPKVSAPR